MIMHLVDGGELVRDPDRELLQDVQVELLLLRGARVRAPRSRLWNATPPNPHTHIFKAPALVSRELAREVLRDPRQDGPHRICMFFALRHKHRQDDWRSLEAGSGRSVGRTHLIERSEAALERFRAEVGLGTLLFEHLMRKAINRSSEANQRSSEANQRSSEAIQGPREAIRGHQRPIRVHRRASRTWMGGR